MKSPGKMRFPIYSVTPPPLLVNSSHCQPLFLWITCPSILVGFCFLFLFLTDPASGLFVQIAQEDTSPVQPRGHTGPSVLTLAEFIKTFCPHKGLYSGAFVRAWASLGA